MDNGTIFKVSASTGLLTTILDFNRNGTMNRGAHPRGKMISDGAGIFGERLVKEGFR
jgi:hypothetical protein